MESCRKGVPGGGNSICKGLEEGEEDVKDTELGWGWRER